MDVFLLRKIILNMHWLPGLDAGSSRSWSLQTLAGLVALFLGKLLTTGAIHQKKQLGE